MVRRWSHINVFSNIKSLSLYVIGVKTSFSFFKANVKFKRLKKLKIKYSKIKRKAFKRLKHRTSLMQHMGIFKFWTLDYRVIRNTARFDYFYYIFLNNTLLFNYSYVCKNNEQLSHNAPFLLSNCSKTMLKALARVREVSNAPLVDLNFLTTKHFVSTFAWSPTVFDEFDQNSYVPTFSKYDNFLTPISLAAQFAPLNEILLFYEFLNFLDFLIFARVALLRQFVCLNLPFYTI